MSQKTLQKSPGFTLIELAVVMSLIAIFIGFAMKLAQQRTEQNLTELTKSRMEHVVKTLERYVRTKGRLPCPADPTLYYTSANFGLERTTGSSGTLDCSDASNLESTGAGVAPDAYAGMLPFHTLNLPHFYALDGWGRRLTYAVDEDLVSEADMGNDPAAGTEGGIVVRHWVTDNTRKLCGAPATLEDCSASTDNAAFVLVSHGANGYGAWGTYGGSARSPSTNAEASRELANANAATTVPVATAAANVGVYYQSPPLGTFDDIVMYRRKWQLPTDCDQISGGCP